MPMIMVTGLNRPTQYDYVIRQYNQKTKKGICLRLTANDLQDPFLHSKIGTLLSSYDLPFSYVDLLVDLKVIQQNALDFEELNRVIPKIDSWRTFTVTSGAFPKDLTEFEKNQEHETPRSDWEFWFNQVQRSGIKRIPSYGDYTIQHAIYYEPTPGSNPSASIRYTSENYWVIMRGEAIRGDYSPGHSQYWGHAIMLSNRPEYCGKDFSAGDKYISYIAGQREHPGTPRTWITAGINHHLVYTVKQIAKTFGISDTEEPKDGWSLGPQPRRDGSKGQRAALSANHQPVLFPGGG
jgi:hypothetical protein